MSRFSWTVLQEIISNFSVVPSLSYSAYLYFGIMGPIFGLFSYNFQTAVRPSFLVTLLPQIAIVKSYVSGVKVESLNSLQISNIDFLLIFWICRLVYIPGWVTSQLLGCLLGVLLLFVVNLSCWDSLSWITGNWMSEEDSASKLSCRLQ